MMAYSGNIGIYGGLISFVFWLLVMVGIVFLFFSVFNKKDKKYSPAFYFISGIVSVLIFIGLFHNLNYNSYYPYDHNNYRGYSMMGGGGWFDDTQSWRGDTYSESTWQDVSNLRDILHEAQFATINTDTGIEISITDATLLDIIQNTLMEDNDDLEEHFNNIDVSIEKIDNGVKYILSSDDNYIIKDLQRSGSWVVTSYLMEEMMESTHGGWGGMMWR